MIYRPYAGIGSQKTPPDILIMMTELAGDLEAAGFTLRSGAAVGADTAFEDGVKRLSKKEIMLPWAWFNDSSSPLIIRNNLKYREARQLAKKFHPKWEVLNDSGKLFHTRNVCQVLGWDLMSPVEFVICWTQRGRMVGGTSQAMRVAQAHGIRIYNLFHERDQEAAFELTTTHLERKKAAST